MTKICMRRLPITRCKRVREHLRPHPIDGPHKVTICYRSISCLQKNKKSTCIVIQYNLFCHVFCSVLSRVPITVSTTCSVLSCHVYQIRHKENTSMGHIGSLSSPTVAEGLKTISAPFNPKANQFKG